MEITCIGWNSQNTWKLAHTPTLSTSRHACLYLFFCLNIWHPKPTGLINTNRLTYGPLKGKVPLPRSLFGNSKSRSLIKDRGMLFSIITSISHVFCFEKSKEVLSTLSSKTWSHQCSNSTALLHLFVAMTLVDLLPTTSIICHQIFV